MSAPLSENALARRIKRWLAQDELEVYVQAIPGLEHLTLGETQAIAPNTSFEVSRGGLTGMVSLVELYGLNLSLRTAQRVLLRIAEGWAGTEEALFNFLAKQPWEHHIGFSKTYRLRTTARSAIFQPGDELTRLISMAIARRYEDLRVDPPMMADTGPELFIRLFRNRCQVSLNTSGAHLHIRGQRTYTSDAPVRETLAAALALLAKSNPDVIVDPFCGGGTLLLEAAQVGAPVERHFGFMDAAWFQVGRYREAQRQRELPPRFANATFVGSDNDPRVLAAAEHNLAGRAELSVGDATEINYAEIAQLHNATQLLIITNLPYGKRVGSRGETPKLVEAFVNQLATAPAGTEIVLLTAHAEAFDVPHLKVDRTYSVKNGGLPVDVVHAFVQ